MNETPGKRMRLPTELENNMNKVLAHATDFRLITLLVAGALALAANYAHARAADNSGHAPHAATPPHAKSVSPSL